MQQCRKAISFFVKRGISFSKLSSSVLPGSRLTTPEQLCMYSSTPKETVPVRHTTAGSGLHPSEPPRSGSFEHFPEGKLSSKKTAAIEGRKGGSETVPCMSTLCVQNEAASDLRRFQDITAAAATKLRAREASAKLRLKLKAAAEGEKERAKMQKAKALVEEAKAEKLQRKALLGKKAPTAWVMFIKDHINAVGYLPRTLRFARISTLYGELTPEQRQIYIDASSKLRMEQATHRAAIRTVKAVYIPTNAYMLYKHDKFPEIKAADRSAKLVDIVKLISKQWWGLSESEKQLLRARVVKMKAERTHGAVSSVSNA